MPDLETPTTTPAVVLKAPGRLEPVEVPVPEPGPGEVLLRVLAVGLCGSDAHWFEDGAIGEETIGEGIILGHEIAAVIATGPRGGERVAVDPAVPCLVCEQCHRGRHNLCTDLRFAGHASTDGGLRGHMVWPERCLVTLPHEMSDDVGAMLEPLGVALHAVDLSGADRAASIGVLGCGPIGLLVVMSLKALGFEDVAAFDPLPHRLRLADEMGAVTAAEPAAADGRFDVVIETAGTDEAISTALGQVRPAGRVVMVGIPPSDRTTIKASLARRREVTMVWCRRMMPGDLVRAVSLATGRSEMLSRLVTGRYPLGETATAFQALVDRRGVKTVVTPGTGGGMEPNRNG